MPEQFERVFEPWATVGVGYAPLGVPGIAHRMIWRYAVGGVPYIATFFAFLFSLITASLP